MSTIRKILTAHFDEATTFPGLDYSTIEPLVATLEAELIEPVVAAMNLWTGVAIGMREAYPADDDTFNPAREMAESIASTYEQCATDIRKALGLSERDTTEEEKA